MPWNLWDAWFPVSLKSHPVRAAANTHLMDYVIDLLRCAESKSLQNIATKGSSRRLEFRSCPVDATDSFPIVATVCIFPIFYHDA